MPKIVDHDQRRAEILDAVWRIVTTRGAEELSIRVIAAEAGVSKSNVTYYFPTRGEILAAAVDRIVSDSWDSAGRILGEGFSIDDLVRATTEVTVPTTPDRRRTAGVWLLLNSEAPGDAELSKVLVEYNRRIRDAAVWALTDLAARSVLPLGTDIELEAARLHALIDGLSLQALADPEAVSATRVAKILSLHFEQMLSRS